MTSQPATQACLPCRYACLDFEDMLVIFDRRLKRKCTRELPACSLVRYKYKSPLPQRKLSCPNHASKVRTIREVVRIFIKSSPSRIRKWFPLADVRAGSEALGYPTCRISSDVLLRFDFPPSDICRSTGSRNASSCRDP